MIAGLLRLLLFQGLGEVVARFVLPAVPGPVIGLVALLLWLQLTRHVPPGLAQVADVFSAHLGLLFVPAAVGVVMFVPLLRDAVWPLAAVLVASSVATIASAAWLLRVLARDGPKGEEPPS